MNPKILLQIARWTWRVFLFILGAGTVMTGWGMCQDPQSVEMGILLFAVGILLPGAEGVFYLLKEVEKNLK